MFKFVHAVNIDLDSPLRGVARYEGMPVEDIRLAARRAFDNLVRFAIDERVASPRRLNNRRKSHHIRLPQR